MYDAASMRARFQPKEDKTITEARELLQSHLYDTMQLVESVSHDSLELKYALPAFLYEAYSEELRNLGYNVYVIKDTIVTNPHPIDFRAPAFPRPGFIDVRCVDEKEAMTHVNTIMKLHGIKHTIALEINWRRKS
ncbi:hypothetical protein VPHD527_0080 [Vibrio phage D527]